MYAFYAVRGYSLDYLANLSRQEKIFLHCARGAYYEEQAKIYEAMFAGKGG